MCGIHWYWQCFTQLQHCECVCVCTLMSVDVCAYNFTYMCICGSIELVQITITVQLSSVGWSCGVLESPLNQFESHENMTVGSVTVSTLSFCAQQCTLSFVMYWSVMSRTRRHVWQKYQILHRSWASLFCCCSCCCSPWTHLCSEELKTVIVKYFCGIIIDGTFAESYELIKPADPWKYLHI